MRYLWQFAFHLSNHWRPLLLAHSTLVFSSVLALALSFLISLSNLKPGFAQPQPPIALTTQVAANTPPVLGTYPAVTLNTRETLVVTPSAPPTDDRGIASLTVTSPGIVPFLGALSIKPDTGEVTIRGAYPPGSFPILVTATDTDGARTTQTFNLTVNCTPITFTPTVLPNANRGAIYSQMIWAIGATYPATFSLVSGALPPGLTLREDGLISGRATESGSFTFTIKATGADGCTGTRQYTLDQGCAAFTINPTMLLNGIEGSFYGQTFEGFGATPPYSYGMQSGTLPPGLTFSPENLGYISGTPTQRGSFTFVVKATDANGCLATRSYMVNIECPPITLSPAELPNITIGTAYHHMLTASGSVAPHTFSLQNGALPPGLSLASNGVMAGTPTQAGIFSFIVKATSANGCTGTRQYVLGCPSITISPAALPKPLPQTGYFQQLTASGGVPPYTYSINGSLPYGMTFFSSGQIGGIVMGTGFFPFTVRVTDANGCSGTRAYVFNIGNEPQINNLAPAAVAVGTRAFSLTVGGVGFLPGAVVKWNGAERPTSFTANGQLHAQISAQDVANPGTASITVANAPFFGSIVSNAVSFTIHAASFRGEADLWTPGEGDGTVEVRDVRQLARYLLKLETPRSGLDFQRADCAPRATKGDGSLSLSDVVQAARYANGFDPVVETGGPAATIAFENSDSDPLEEGQRQPNTQITALDGNFTRGRLGALPIQINATGTENALGFTLHYDHTRLSFLDFQKQPFAPANDEVFVNEMQPGKLGIIYLAEPGRTLTAGISTLLTLRFIPNGGAGNDTVTFSFSDELVARAAVAPDAATLPVPVTTALTGMVTEPAPAFLSAASFMSGALLAPNSVVATFGTGLALMTATATSLPLPTTLGGTTVTIIDRTDVAQSAPLFFVSPGQLNFLLPAAVVEGPATILIRAGANMFSSVVRINAVAPGVFAAMANGRGLAAAQFLRVLSDGTQRYEPVARFDMTTGQFVGVPFEFSQAGEEVFLVLYGTGIRGRSALTAVTATLGSVSAEVVYAGNQGSLAGLDQVNLRLPRTLAGRGEVEVVLTVDGRRANPVRVNFK